MAKAAVEGAMVEIQDGMTYLELAEKYQKNYPHEIILVLENGKMRELFRKVKNGAKVEFLTTGQSDGYRTYKRSATLLLLKAVFDVAGMEAASGIRVHFSVSHGYYCTSRNAAPDAAFLQKVQERMEELVRLALPIKKKTIPVDEAIEYFSRHGMSL